MKKTLLLAIGILAVFGVACSKHDKQKTDKTYITIKGSDTMVHLVSAWAEEFMKINPKLEVSVTGGGSGTGIAALLNNMTDICAASRKIKAKEKELAEKKGISPNEIVVASDGIALVLNANNPITALSMKQLKSIYTGVYDNWSQVGGPNKKIVLTSRDSSSGTYVFFQEHVLEKEDYTPNAMLMPATSSIIQTVSANTWAIGYVGLGYALKAGATIKTLKVKTEKKSSGVKPSVKTVKSGEYPISRPLHLYINGKAKGTVKKFVDFALSPQGQKIVSETGYISQ